MSKPYYVYICASRRNKTISVGMTNDICRRAWEHREGLIPGFTKKYGVKMLVSDEQFSMSVLRYIAKRVSKNGNVSGRSISFRSITLNGTTCTKL